VFVFLGDEDIVSLENCHPKKLLAFRK